MPGFIARKLCPELLFVPPDFTKYTYYSDLTRKGWLYDFEAELKLERSANHLIVFGFFSFPKL